VSRHSSIGARHQEQWKCPMGAAGAGPGSQGPSHPLSQPGAIPAPGIGHLPGDGQASLGCEPGSALPMAGHGRTMERWRPAPPALLRQGLLAPGADMGSWVLGRLGKSPGRGCAGTVSNVCKCSQGPYSVDRNERMDLWWGFSVNRHSSPSSLLCKVLLLLLQC